MSSFEYLSMFKKCQNVGTFHMFVFDLKDSKKMNPEILIDAETKLKKMINEIYLVLKNIEQKTAKKILLEDELLNNECWIKDEPYFFADSASITIYKNSIDNETFFKIYNIVKEKNKFNYDLHIADGYYETLKWCEGNEKFARSYCFDILSNMHKSKNIIKKKLK